MVPNVSRGFSFKGVTAYLMGDKRDDAAPDMAGIEQDGPGERVGFTKVLNFVGDEARDPYEAAKIMALVVRDADQIKAAAGVKATGRRAEGPPVWHLSLSWHGSEKPDQSEMMRAVESSLEAVGLGLEKGYQTVIVQHTDTPHPHLHVVVNLVHPLTGKQINPYRDQQKAQAWANRYEKERGHVFCEDRAAKYAEIEKAKATGEKGKRPWMSRDQWLARVQQGKDGAAALKADLAQRYAAQKQGHQTAFERRGAEVTAFYAGRKRERDAIREKYQQALDAVWQSPQRLIDNRTGPTRDFSHLARGAMKAAARLDARRRAFERREATALGRLSNAIRVAGKDASFGRIVMLAVLAGERRQAFESQLRREQFRQMPPMQRTPQRRANVETKAQRAAEIKQRRAAELAAFDGKTAWQGTQIRDRHEQERTAERAERQQLGREAEDRWRQHREAYGWTSPNRAKFRAASGTRSPQGDQQTRRANARADARFRAQSAGIDARQAQRTARQGQTEFRQRGSSAAEWREHANQQEAKEARERAERQETTPDASEAFQRQSAGPESASETKPAPASAEAGQERRTWTAEEVGRFQQIKADRAAERSREPGQEHDPGRTI